MLAFRATAACKVPGRAFRPATWLLLWCEPAQRLPVLGGLALLILAAASLAAWRWYKLIADQPALLQATLDGRSAAMNASPLGHHPHQNHLLAVLQASEFDRIAPHLELMPMRLGEVLCRWLLLTLDRRPCTELTMTQELIASMLGVRREGITEAAGRLQDLQLIRCRRGHITVVDRAGLERQACECYAVVRNEFTRLLSDAGQPTRRVPAHHP